MPLLPPRGQGNRPDLGVVQETEACNEVELSRQRTSGTPASPAADRRHDWDVHVCVGGFLSAVGFSEHNAATAWWLALVVGLVVTGLTAVTGFTDWIGITWGTPLW